MDGLQLKAFFEQRLQEMGQNTKGELVGMFDSASVRIKTCGIYPNMFCRRHDYVLTELLVCLFAFFLAHRS